MSYPDNRELSIYMVQYEVQRLHNYYNLSTNLEYRTIGAHILTISFS